MSRYFVDSTPVPVFEWDDDPNMISDRAPNVIYIRPKMDVATKGRVISEMFGIAKGTSEMEARLGQNETALLIHNILRWEGPDLGTVACNRANIEKLDPTEPHIARVLEAIAERNASPKAQKESATNSISTNDGATDSATRPVNATLQLVNGEQKLRSPSALAGYLKKSEP